MDKSVKYPGYVADSEDKKAYERNVAGALENINLDKLGKREERADDSEDN